MAVVKFYDFNPNSGSGRSCRRGPAADPQAVLIGSPLALPCSSRYLNLMQSRHSPSILSLRAEQ
jgi:hypothetical protein